MRRSWSLVLPEVPLLALSMLLVSSSLLSEISCFALEPPNTTSVSSLEKSAGLSAIHKEVLSGTRRRSDRILIPRHQHQVDWKILARSGHTNELSFVDDDELCELLARLYARLKYAKIQLQFYLNSQPKLQGTQEELPVILREVKMKLQSDDESVKSWLHESKQAFGSLKDAKLELLSGYPNRTINVCQDGPKILILPDVRGILYCYTREQWIEKLWWDLRSSAYQYCPIIILNIVIFLVGVTGNIFVCLSVYRNHQLRNVTNYFIVNLAFADLLVILICLPATQIWDLSLTWFFGTIPCKLVIFLQDVSISVSVLTLTAISLDRYYAICHPLKFKSSLNQAKRIIALIWLISLAIMSPDLIYLSAHPSQDLQGAGIDTVFYSDCNYDWTEHASKSFQFVKTILLYLLPFILMLWAHYKIMQTLRLASSETNTSSANLDIVTEESELTFIKPLVVNKQIHCLQHSNKQIHFNFDVSEDVRHDEGGLVSAAAAAATSTEDKTNMQADLADRDATSEVSNQPTSAIELDKEGSKITATALPVSCNHLSAQFKVTMHNKSKLKSRRKAAKMLTAIMIIFGICYLPVHLINFLRQFRDDIPQTEMISSLSMLAHSICYLNSAINPIIYNHMNSVFRAEFKKFFSSCCRLFWRRQTPNSNKNLQTKSSFRRTQDCPSSIDFPI